MNVFILTFSFTTQKYLLFHYLNYTLKQQLRLLLVSLKKIINKTNRNQGVFNGNKNRDILMKNKLATLNQQME